MTTPQQEFSRPPFNPDTGVFKKVGATGEETPYRTQGKLTVGGEEFDFASGGAGHGSIPYGTYHINPSAIGRVGRRIDAAAGLSPEEDPSSNNIYNPLTRRMGEGVEIHPGLGRNANIADQMKTLGCVAVPPKEWPLFKAALQREQTLFRNSNANLFATDLSDPKSRLRLHKDERLMDQVMNPDQGYEFMLKNDPTQGIKTLTAAINDLGQAVASPALQQVGPILQGVSGWIKDLSQLAQDHPKLAATAGVGAGALGLRGSGYLAYQFANGFGLSKSAVALDGSAAALTAAAKALGGSCCC